MKTCTATGCAQPHVARGLCKPHWRRQYGKPNPTFVIECTWCGRRHEHTRRDGQFCSDFCKGAWYSVSTVATCEVPDLHASRSCLVPAEHLSRMAPRFQAGKCAWCGDGYVIAAGRPHLYCSETCGRRAARRRRRAREFGAGGSFTWDGFMSLALKLGGCCAYCERRPQEPLEPDHVVPLSRGGHNGLTNILPACKACNSSKRDQLLHEWAAFRAARGLPARRTDVSHFAHLSAHVHAPERASA